MTVQVIEFPSTKWVAAELDGGVITRSTTPGLIGHVRYFVDMIDDSGVKLGIWDGPSYDAAREILAECKRDGLAVADLIGGSP